MDPSYINSNLSHTPRHSRSQQEYVQGIVAGDRVIISECITLLESTHDVKRNLGLSVLAACPPPQKTTLRLGITGTPGVGKSTFIENFGLALIAQKRRIAVLAVDPSSAVSQGSILGDKTRMETLSVNPDAFIRPTPSANMLGGTAAHTGETISLCEAGGFDTILIETVGVGQSEIEVDNLVDVSVLLLQPGAGDDMQGIKRGILEKADIIIVHKADGPQLELARKTKQLYDQTLQMFQHDIAQWQRPIILVSSIDKIGFDGIEGAINQFVALSRQSGQWEAKRQNQAKRYLSSIAEQISLDFFKNLTAYKDALNESYQSNKNLYSRITNLQNNLKSIIDKLEDK